ncbi:hypothetical protein EZV62_023607 [Acer yangbiense]|uniref:Uncharacterized protein n=1 Tax=Acer yangbiense TaxID=1000413 RepID=A0A5C7H279_9ROSI|nr:hypothetical protein EZV62_023607 [Acer yangbiense]
MAEYLKTAKSLVDNIALARKPDLVSQVLTGLDTLKYNPVVKSLLTMMEPRTQHLKVVRTEAKAHFKATNRGLYGNRGGRSCVRGGRGNNSRHICQVYVRIGHTVVKCYYRYDETYNGSPQDQSKGNINNNNSTLAKVEIVEQRMMHATLDKRQNIMRIDTSDTSEAIIESATGIAEKGRHHMITRAKDGIHKPKRYPVEYYMFTVVKSEMPAEPCSIQEALNSEAWLTAMKDEIDTLQGNKT